MKNVLICALVVLTAGCSTTPNYDQRFGESVRRARTAMLIHPAGAPESGGTATVDGQATREAYTRYLNTFKEPPPIVNVINIGGPIGNGGAK